MTVMALCPQFRSRLLATFSSALLVLAANFFTVTSQATVTLTNQGFSSVNTVVSFRADLSISGDTLTLVLSNTSPVASLAPNDTLGSFYWDIIGPGNTRPTLTLSSVVGDVYLGDKNSVDPLQTANANLRAVSSGYGWVFRGDLNTSLQPLFAFGVGAVGNNNLTPNNFDGNLTDGVDYSIYRGDVTTQNLHNKLLAKDEVVFTFSGVSGFTEADILNRGAFGLGTAPDSLMEAVPEPGAATLLILGLVAYCGRRTLRGLN